MSCPPPSFCIRICPGLLHRSAYFCPSLSFNIFALVFTILFASVFIALAILSIFFSLITLGLFWPGDGVLYFIYLFIQHLMASDGSQNGKMWVIANHEEDYIHEKETAEKLY